MPTLGAGGAFHAGQEPGLRQETNRDRDGAGPSSGWASAITIREGTSKRKISPWAGCRSTDGGSNPSAADHRRRLRRPVGGLADGRVGDGDASLGPGDGVGFTGGVVVTFLNGQQNIIGSTDVQTFGVDALGVFWKPSHRTDSWSWGVPAGTAAITVFHKWAPRDRWSEIIAEISEWLGKAAEAQQKYEEFCQQYPSLCEYSDSSG